MRQPQVTAWTINCNIKIFSSNLFHRILLFRMLFLGNTSHKKNRFLLGIAQITSDDYDNDVSDHDFGTFDDFGVKNDQKVSLYMILMSKYKGQHGGKKG